MMFTTMHTQSPAPMKTRVTITLDPDVHARAKQAARARRTTLSGLIETYLRSPAAAPVARGSKGSLVDAMVGSAALRALQPGVDPLFDALRARHVGSPATPARAPAVRRRAER